jgi:hypothetical protein
MPPQVEFHRNQIFYRLPETLCQDLFDSGETRAVSAGEIILDESDHPDSLYIVLKGRMEALLPRTESRVTAVRLSELGPGDCFGEYAFIDQQPASASVRALTDAEVFSIGYEALRTYLNAHPTIASIVYQNLLHILVRRLRATNAELDLFTLSFAGETTGNWAVGDEDSALIGSIEGMPKEPPADIGKILEQFFQAIESRDMSLLPLAEGATYSGTMLPEGAEGADAVRKYMSGTAPFIKSFRVEDAIVEDRSAAVMVQYEAINEVHFEGCYFIDFEDGEIARIRTVFDSRPLMKGGMDE